MIAATVAASAAPLRALASDRAPSVFFDGDAVPAREAYDKAISHGADFLVAPVAMSLDGGLVAVADIEMSAFTDVARRPEFASRRGEKSLSGVATTGWFCDDFTLAELQTLATGPAIRTRTGTTAPTLLSLQAVIDIARAGSVRTARVVGVSPRLVRPAYFAGGDLAMEPALARMIALNGYNSRAASMIVQASDPASLKAFGALSQARRVLLAPVDESGLADARRTAEGIGVPDERLIEGGPKGPLSGAPLIAAAHGAGLALFAHLRPAIQRDRLLALFVAGVDGVMGGDVALAVRARREAMDRRRPPPT